MPLMPLFPPLSLSFCLASLALRLFAAPSLEAAPAQRSLIEESSSLQAPLVRKPSLFALGQQSPKHEGQELLKKEDIEPTLQKIFDLHIHQKQWDLDLLKRSVRSYFDQFDPYRIYLLQSEVEALFGRSEKLWQEDLKAVKQGDWGLFVRVHRMTKQAIWRAKLWREKEMSRLLGKKMRPSKTLPATGWSRSVRQLEQRYLQFVKAQLYEAQRLDPQKQQELFEDLFSAHEETYLMEHQAAGLSEEQKEHLKAQLILAAVAASFDAHSAVISKSYANSLREQLEKQYVGIGIWIEPRSDAEGKKFYIGKILDESPAALSGKLAVGDRILRVEGIEVEGKELAEVMALMQGKKGQVIELMVEKPSLDRVQVALALRPITLDGDRTTLEVREKHDGLYARIALSSFYESEEGPSSVKDLEKLLLQLKERGEIKGLILDLRDNTGGFLTQAVKVAGLFIPTGVVAIAKYSDGSLQYWRDEDLVDWYDGPLLVLVSKMSASASEIVAQCLQDYGVALVVGDARTYGKGSIQFHNLLDPDASAHYKVTVGKYYTVSGRTTQLEGVVSDFIVPGPKHHLQIGERYRPGALENDQIEPSYYDTLGDVGPRARVWYLKNYLPFMQRRSTQWITPLDYLKSRSKKRVEQFLARMPLSNPIEQEEEMERFQVDEAFTLLEEMQSHLRKEPTP